MRRLLLASLLLLLVPVAHAGTADAPELTDPDDVGGDAPFSSYDAIDVIKAWLELETPDSFVIAVEMAGDLENDAPTGTSQELRYSLKLTYQGTTITSAATLAGDTLTGAEADGAVMRFTVARNAWANVRPGQLIEDMTVETSGWTVSDSASTGSDTAPDEAGTALDYLVGSQAEPGMDYDNDGIDDRDEVNGPTDPANPDTDLDGLKDGEEANYGTDPTVADSDGDGLIDGDEVDLGTDPTLADTDGDGINDGDEINGGTDPLLTDSDGDGIDDGDEINGGTDPTRADTDGDGIDDQTELDNALDPTDRSDGAMDHDGDGVTTADELAAGTDPYVSDLEESAITSDGPAGLPYWLWAVIAAFILLIITLIIWFAALARRKDEPEDEEPEDELEVIELEEGEASNFKPLVIDEEYLTEGLEPEDIQRARRLFEERERRYLDQAYPGRSREYEDELPEPETDKKSLRNLEREKALRDRQATKEAKKAAKEAAKEAKLQARLAKEIEKRK